VELRWACELSLPSCPTLPNGSDACGQAQVRSVRGRCRGQIIHQRAVVRPPSNAVGKRATPMASQCAKWAERPH